MATMHLKLKNYTDVESFEDVKTQAEAICKRYGIDHLTVQIDLADKICDECDL